MSGATLSQVSCMSTAARHWNLRALLAGLTSAAVPDVEITDLTLDSRQVGPGAAFIALQGLRTHGLGYAQQVVAAGAVAILYEPVANLALPRVPAHVALVAVPELNAVLGALAERFFAAPARQLRVAGVTGTNGKTTTAYLIAAAAERLAGGSGYIGTIGSGPIHSLQAATHTTPDVITVHRLLADFHAASIGLVGMEVSSHALDLQRVAGMHFDTVVFTNLTHDHLDFHGSLEAYGAAKHKLFAWPELRHAVINADDAFGQTLLANRCASITTAYSQRGSAVAGIRNVLARSVRAGAHGVEVDIDGDWGQATLPARLIGDFNVDNLLATLAVLLGWDVPLHDAIHALESCDAPPGRMEVFTTPGGPLVIVDYAHTPDALEKALHAARQHCRGRLLCVFGCGGDRDPGKRPMMGMIAERDADRVVITDDNPRTEDGNAIIAGIVSGLQQPNRVAIERDRAAAIELAVRLAGANDVVLVAGKGHEDYQIVGTQTRHFSDREVVRSVLGRAP